jgi:hypothetical protein
MVYANPIDCCHSWWLILLGQKKVFNGPYRPSVKEPVLDKLKVLRSDGRVHGDCRQYNVLISNDRQSVCFTNCGFSGKENVDTYTYPRPLEHERYCIISLGSPLRSEQDCISGSHQVSMEREANKNRPSTFTIGSHTLAQRYAPMTKFQWSWKIIKLRLGEYSSE